MEIILLNILGLVHPNVIAINTIARALFFINFFLWLLPPFRQYKGGFFLYFLVLAVTDPLSMILSSIFHILPSDIYAPSSIILLFVSLYYLKSLEIRIIMLNLLICLIDVVFYLKFHNTMILIGLMAFLHLEIFSFFLTYFIRKLINRNILYTYLLILVFYEFSVFIKSFSFVFDLKTGLAIIHLLNILEVFIGLYFIIFNLKTSPKLHPKLK
jgi:hypothetical protein